MVEIEAKILDVSHKDYEKKIISLGGKKIYDGEILSIFLSDESDDFKNRTKLLRLRKEGEETFIAFKSKIIESSVDKAKTKKHSAKIREEIEVRVDDFDSALQIFEKLGFKETGRSIKRRISYLIEKKNIRLDFDIYKGNDSYIPEYLEIEGDDEKAIEEFGLKMGFKLEDMKPWGFTKVQKHYREKMK